jgi:hypothetical protein
VDFTPSFVQSFEQNNPGIPPQNNTTLILDTARHSFTIFEPFVYESRNFYQYRNFTLKYSPDRKIVGINPYPIVAGYTWDPDENVMTLNQKDYNEPYYGKIISFWIQAEDLTLVEKTVEILP